MSDRFIYLVEAQNELIKIGSSRAPKDRLQAIRLYSPVLVRLIAMWPMETGEELDLHARLSGQRSHKEWFRCVAGVARLVEEKRGQGVDQIPAWSELTYRAELQGPSRLSGERSAAAKARWADPEWRAWWHERHRHHAQPVLAEPARQSA